MTVRNARCSDEDKFRPLYVTQKTNAAQNQRPNISASSLNISCNSSAVPKPDRDLQKPKVIVDRYFVLRNGRNSALYYTCTHKPRT